MGLTTAKLTLKNPRKPELPAVEVDALVDTGAVFLCIPPQVQAQLQFGETERKQVTFANGRQELAPYVGPVELHFKNRSAYVGALVVGKEVLLGAIPMEDMDLVVIPKTRTVDIHPDHPDFAQGRV